jgi:hypothetical protein
MPTDLELAQQAREDMRALVALDRRKATAYWRGYQHWLSANNYAERWEPADGPGGQERYVLVDLVKHSGRDFT